MYVTIDLGVRTPAVESWLDSVREPSGAKVPVQRFGHIRMAALDLSPAQIEQGRGRGLSISQVESLHVMEMRVTGDPVPLDKLPIKMPWNQELIGRRELAATGADVKVGHIDSGMNPLHPLLRKRPAGFASFHQNGPYVDIDTNATAYDSGYHGTATGSLICGLTPIGIAPDVSLYSAALDGPPWSDAMLAAAVDWAVGQDVRIMWLGVERQNEFCAGHETLVTKLLNLNILPVTAVGNVGAGSSSTPGNCKDGLSVGAVRSGQPGPIMWNSSGSQVRPDERLKPDVVAPGCDVLVASFCERENSTDYYTIPAAGTSFAGPHVVAMAALCLQLNPNLTAGELADGICHGSRLLNLDYGRANHGVPYGANVRKTLGLP